MRVVGMKNANHAQTTVGQKGSFVLLARARAQAEAFRDMPAPDSVALINAMTHRVHYPEGSTALCAFSAEETSKDRADGLDQSPREPRRKIHRHAYSHREESLEPLFSTRLPREIAGGAPL